MIIVELTDRQTYDFCLPTDILTKFDSKKLNLANNQFRRFFTGVMYP